MVLPGRLLSVFVGNELDEGDSWSPLRAGIWLDGFIPSETETCLRVDCLCMGFFLGVGF